MNLNEAFLKAVRNQDLNKAKEYFSIGADVNFYQEGFTPLCAAINNKDMPMFNFLIKTGKLSKKEIISCLPIALYKKEKNMAQSLIAHTDEVYQPFFSVDSFIKLAIDNGYPDLLESMLEKGLSTNKCADLELPPLHYAATKKDPVYVQILGRYVDVDDTKDEEVTPLMIAAQRGNTKTMDALLKMGADPEAEQEPKVTINFLIPSILRAGLVKLNMDYIDSVIHKAVSSGKTETIDVLLKHKPNLNLNAKGTDAKTPLMIAAEQNNKEMVHHLLKLGVDVNLRRGEGNALHSAVDGNSTDAIKLLLIYGIDLYHQANNHQTPLTKAINENRRYGHPDKNVIDLLTEADKNIKKITSQKPTYFPGRDPNQSRQRGC